MPPLRLPGQPVDEGLIQLRDKVDDLLTLPLCLVALALFEWWRWWLSVPPNPLLFTIVALIPVLHACWKVIVYKAEKKDLILGRDEERTVGQLLEELRESGYRVFHDIPGPDFNVDHVVVGPAGIFTIETKTRSKPIRGNQKVLYNGKALGIAGERSSDEPLI